MEGSQKTVVQKGAATPGRKNVRVRASLPEESISNCSQEGSIESQEYCQEEVPRVKVVTFANEETRNGVQVQSRHSRRDDSRNYLEQPRLRRGSSNFLGLDNRTRYDQYDGGRERRSVSVESLEYNGVEDTRYRGIYNRRSSAAAELDTSQEELLLAEEDRSPTHPGFERLHNEVEYRRGYVAGSSEERQFRAATITHHPSSYREVTGGRMVLFDDPKRLAPRTPSSQLIYKTSSPGVDREMYRPRSRSRIRPEDVEVRAALSRSNRQPSKWEHDSFSSLKPRRERSVSRSPLRLTGYRSIRSSNDPNDSPRHGVDIYCTPRVPSSVNSRKRSRSRIYDDGTHSQSRQRAMTRMPETSGSRAEDQRLQRARSESCIRDSEPDVNVSRRDSSCLRLVRSPNLRVKDQETTPSQKSSLMSVFSHEIAKSIVTVLNKSGVCDGLKEESNQLLHKRRALQDITRGIDNVYNSAGQEGLTFTEDDSIAGIDPMEEEVLDEEDAFFQRKLNCSVNQFLKLTFQPSSSKNNDCTTEPIPHTILKNHLQNPRQVYSNKSRAVENTDARGSFPEQWLETAPSANAQIKTEKATPIVLTSTSAGTSTGSFSTHVKVTPQPAGVQGPLKFQEVKQKDRKVPKKSTSQNNRSRTPGAPSSSIFKVPAARPLVQSTPKTPQKIKQPGTSMSQPPPTKLEATPASTSSSQGFKSGPSAEIKASPSGTPKPVRSWGPGCPNIYSNNNNDQQWRTQSIDKRLQDIMIQRTYTSPSCTFDGFDPSAVSKSTSLVPVSTSKVPEPTPYEPPPRFVCFDDQRQRRSTRILAKTATKTPQNQANRGLQAVQQAEEQHQTQAIQDDRSSDVGYSFPNEPEDSSEEDFFIEDKDQDWTPDTPSVPPAVKKRRTAARRAATPKTPIAPFPIPSARVSPVPAQPKTE